MSRKRKMVCKDETIKNRKEVKIDIMMIPIEDNSTNFSSNIFQQDSQKQQQAKEIQNIQNNLNSQNNDENQDQDKKQQLDPKQTLKLIEEVLDCKFNPQKVEYREKEKKTIKDYLQKCLNNEQDARCLLLTGIPGTGKTLLTNSILDELLEERIHYQKNGEQELKQIVVLKFNAMRFKNCRDFFEALYENIFFQDQNYVSDQIIQKIKQKSFSTLIEEIFMFLAENSEDKEFVVMIDEFDSLFNQNNDIFEIFSLAQFLILIGISNSMEMFQELKRKYKISQGLIDLDQIENVVFQTYSPKIMQEIIQQRLDEIKIKTSLQKDLFQPKSLNLVSMSVYSKGGDIRTLLDICRSALRKKILELIQTTQNQEQNQNNQKKINQMIDLEQIKPVGLCDLNLEIEKSFNISQKYKNTIVSLPQQIQLVMVSIHNIKAKEPNLLEIPINRILLEFQTISLKAGHLKPTLSILNEHLKVLEAYNLIQFRNKQTKGKGCNDLSKLTVHSLIQIQEIYQFLMELEDISEYLKLN